jgi:glycosyltransferase involved in cell wall biosynthesis
VAWLLLNELAGAGVEVTALCPGDGDQTWRTDGGVRVQPWLRFRDGLPHPRADQVRDAALLREATEDADVLLTFDRAPLERQEIPWVLALHSLTYGDARYALSRDDWRAVVTPSADLAERARARVSREGIVTIPNPVDLRRLRPVDPAAWRSRLRIPADARALAFPHRADPAKGTEAALRATRRLVATDPRFLLLVPENPEPIYADRYREMRARVAELDLGEHVLMHPWVGAADMPAHLSLAERSLCLSELPEGFGLGPVEAVACGTPAVSTRVGAQGDVLPAGHGVAFVEPGDVDAVVDAVLTPVAPAELERGRKLLVERHHPPRVAEQYRALLERVARTEAPPLSAQDVPHAPS